MPWLEPVTLHGAHARLEPLSHDHIDGLVEAVRDGELWKLWYTFIPTAENMKKEIDRRLGLFRRPARCCRSRCSMPTARSRACRPT